MASRRRGHAAGVADSENHVDPAYVVYKIGIYGWRKRCLYFFILLILIMAILNLGLTIWIMRVQDFSLNGMGKLTVTENGILLDGSADFVKALRAKYILSRKDSELNVQSTKGVTINARDPNGDISGQIQLKNDKVQLMGKKLEINDETGQNLLYADKDTLRLNVKGTEFVVPGGLKFDTSLETSRISAGPYKTLTLESLTKNLYMNAAQGIEMASNANDMKFESLYDTSLVSKKGKILLNAKHIVLDRLPVSDQSGPTVTFPDAKEVCICPDGKLFLAPADASNPCRLVSGVC